MSTPFFSVIIPAYNPGAYLEQTIQSVVEQTFTDWEIIVIDDGSRADESKQIAQVVEEASRQFPDGKIRCSRQENQGVSVTRNRGATQARAQWLAFLDNDDMWRPAMLNEIHRVLDTHPDTELCHTNFDYIDEKTDFIGHGFGRSISYLSFLAGNFPLLPCCNVISKSAFHEVGGFDPLYPLSQDLDLYLKIYQRALPVRYIDEPLALYRRHEQNVSQNYRGSYREISHILQKHLILGLNTQNVEVARAARRGLKRIKSTYGEQGTVASIRSFQKKNLLAAAAHGTYALSLHPPSLLTGIANGLKRKVGKK